MPDEIRIFKKGVNAETFKRCLYNLEQLELTATDKPEIDNDVMSVDAESNSIVGRKKSKIRGERCVMPLPHGKSLVVGTVHTQAVLPSACFPLSRRSNNGRRPTARAPHNSLPRFHFT